MCSPNLLRFRFSHLPEADALFFLLALHIPCRRRSEGLSVDPPGLATPSGCRSEDPGSVQRLATVWRSEGISEDPLGLTTLSGCQFENLGFVQRLETV